MDPVDGVEDRIGAAIARIQIIDAFDVGVTGGLEHLHQHGLAGLGFVNDGFCTDFEAADTAKVDGVFMDEGSQSRQGDGIDISPRSVVGIENSGRI